MLQQANAGLARVSQFLHGVGTPLGESGNRTESMNLSRTPIRRSSHRVRLDINHSDAPSPTFVPLTLFRGLAGVAFLCFGELFWMHLGRIGLEEEGKVLGSMVLLLGTTMTIGALCGAGGILFSADEGGRLALLASVYLAAPLSLADLLVAMTFTGFRSQVLRFDYNHEQERGRRPNPPSPGRDPDDPEAQAEWFQRMYDMFLFLALAFSVLEMLMFRLGRRRLAAAAAAAGRGPSSFLSAGALQSLLDEEDVRQGALDSWPGHDVQESLDMQGRYEQLRRSSLDRKKGLMEHTRGGNGHSL